MKKRIFGLELKLIVIFLAIIVFPMIFVGIFSYSNAKKTFENTRIQELESITDLKVHKIISFFKERKNNIILVQKNPLIKSSFNDLNNNRNNINARKEIDTYIKVLQNVYAYANIMLINTSGKIVYSCNSDNYWPSYAISELPELKKAFIEGKKKISLSDIFVNKFENNLFGMFISGPIYDSVGKLLGTVVFEIDMQPVYDFIQDITGLGQTGETIIVKKAGKSAIYINPLRHEINAAFKEKAILTEKNSLPMIEAVNGKNGSGIAVDYRDEPVIAVWQYIPDVNWGIITKIDMDEAFELIFNLRNLIFFLEFINILLGSLVILSITRSVFKPIAALHKGAQIIEKGNLDYKIGIDINDEIGEISQAFEQMSNKLKSITISRDELKKEIEKRKQIEEKLKKTNTDLEQFTYMISHDLKEPLRNVGSYARLLEESYKGQLDKEADQFITFILHGVNRMNTLINDLLGYSRLSSKSSKFNLIDFENILEQTVDNLKTIINENNATINHSYLPVLAVDESQILMLVQNLISNAIKFRSQEPPVINIKAQQKDDYYLFSVEDNGIGINNKESERIFLIFQRLHTNTYPGTGIGLSVCKKIVEYHGGKIWVESEKDKGATFYFTIPSGLEQNNG